MADTADVKVVLSQYAQRHMDEHTRFIAARTLRAFAAKITDDGDVASLIKEQMIVDADWLYPEED